MKLSRVARANLLLLLTALVWGFAFVAQRLGMSHVGPFTFNGVRFLLGAFALVPLWVYLHRRERGPSVGGEGKVWWRGVVLGVALFAGASLQQVGIVDTTSGKAGFITGLYVVLVPLLGLTLGQRAGGGTWLGALLAAVGLYLLSVVGDLQMGSGDLLVLIGALFWAVHVLLAGALAKDGSAYHVVTLSCVQFVVCGVFSLVAALGTEVITTKGLVNAMPAVAYGGLVSVGVGYTLQLLAQRDAKPAHAAILLSLEAVFAAVGGYLVLHEQLQSRQVAGCGLMLAGMLVSQLRR